MFKYILKNSPNSFLDGEWSDRQSLVNTAKDCGMNPVWVEKNIQEIDTDSEEYIMRNIPKEFHNALSYMAYEQGHAYGQSEIIYHLKSLVEGLEKPIQKFEERLRDDLKN